MLTNEYWMNKPQYKHHLDLLQLDLPSDDTGLLTNDQEDFYGYLSALLVELYWLYIYIYIYIYTIYISHDIYVVV